jgi:hypothetical protein
LLYKNNFEVEMKNNNCFFYLFLVSALLQVSSSVNASELDGSASSRRKSRCAAADSALPGSDSASSAASSSFQQGGNEEKSDDANEVKKLVPAASKRAASRNALSAQARYSQLRNFALRAQQMSNKRRAFLGALAIALSIWNNKEAAIWVALKWVMAVKGLEWCIISFDGMMRNGTPSHVLVHTGDQPSGAAQDKIRSLPGKKFEFSLDDVDILTGKTFNALREASGNQPYILAELRNGSDHLMERHHVDATTLHSSIKGRSSFLSDLLHENDEHVYPFTIIFQSQRADQGILDIHYFELTQEGSLVSIGSLYSMDDPNKPEVKQRLLTTFVGMLSKQECDQELANLATKIEDGKCFKTSQKDENCTKAIILLKAILERVKQNDKSQPLDNDVLLATHLLASVYEIKGEVDLAKQTLNNVACFALLQKMCKLDSRLAQA